MASNATLPRRVIVRYRLLPLFARPGPVSAGAGGLPGQGRVREHGAARRQGGRESEHDESVLLRPADLPDGDEAHPRCAARELCGRAQPRDRRRQRCLIDSFVRTDGRTNCRGPTRSRAPARVSAAVDRLDVGLWTVGAAEHTGGSCLGDVVTVGSFFGTRGPDRSSMSGSTS